jgi:hypothetical protein
VGIVVGIALGTVVGIVGMVVGIALGTVIRRIRRIRKYCCDGDCSAGRLVGHSGVGRLVHSEHSLFASYFLYFVFAFE